MNIAARTDQKESVAFGLLVILAIATAVFSDFATDISKWAVCYSSYLRDSKGCSSDSIAEAAMLATMFSTFFAVLSACYAARHKGKSGSQFALMIVVALVAALFSVLKSSVGEHGFPSLEPLKVPLMVFVISTFVLTGPIFINRHHEQQHRSTGDVEILEYISFAVFIGAFFGTLLQLIDELFWIGPGAEGSVKNLVIAPIAIVVGGAIFSLLITQSARKNISQRISWPFIWAALGFVISFLYAIYYIYDHPWLKKDSSNWFIFLLSGTVVLSSSFITLSIVRAQWKESSINVCLLVATPFATSLSGLAAYAIGLISSSQLPKAMIGSDFNLFVVIHTCAPALAYLTVYASVKLSSLMHDYLWTPQK